MTKSPFVFLDPKGKRWTRFKLIALFVSFFMAICFSVFLAALSIRPELVELPKEVANLRVYVQAEKNKLETNPNLKGIKDAKKIAKSLEGLHARTANAEVERGYRQITAGFLVPWDSASLVSFQRHKGQLTHVVADWFELEISDSKFTLSEPQDEEDKLAQVSDEDHLKLILTVGNYKDGQFNPEAVEELLRSKPEVQEELVKSLKNSVKRLNGNGILLEFDEVDPACQREMTEFIRLTADVLHQNDLELWLAIPLDISIKLFDIPAISGHVDRFVALFHDENGEKDEPGPIASTQWLTSWLDTLKKYISLSDVPQKWIASIGSYGYDWSDGKVETVGFGDVMTMLKLADKAQTRLAIHESESNLLFSYKDSYTDHAVWFLDAITFYNHLKAVEPFFAGGIIIHSLGTEDPGVWSILEQRQVSARPIDNQSLLSDMFSEVTLDDIVPSIGEGNILQLSDQPPFAGHRKIRTTDGGLLWEEYDRFPEGPVLIRNFKTDKQQVVITFDDGPDPEWTPAILDILKEKHAKAVFFVTGNNAERYPGLIKRILQEGHEIGNHTYTHPNLCDVSEERGMLELNATQRLLQHLTGRSTLLFRPPYSTQQGPKHLHELQPLRLAQALGYVVVSHDIDSEDYTMPGADKILKEVMAQRTQGGSIILLHDAGGDRSQTVDALPGLIDYLNMRGDKISSLSEVMRISPETVMPPVTGLRQSQFFSMFVSGNTFQAMRIFNSAIWIFLAFAGILLILKTVIITTFAMLNASEHRKNKGINPFFSNRTSVVIPAYNEEKVIEATVKSVLASDFQDELEVIVVDDGSKDNTAGIVDGLARQDARVKLIKQPNQGKAHALKAGIEAALHPVIVTLDADTIFLPSTIANLIQPLADQSVGAVSGNAKVGNQNNWIGRFQTIEYLCGFNLEKMAYEALDCITVAPGAISAFRKEALEKAGNIQFDTLAEDTDMTLAMHNAGYKIAFAPEAIAMTEAPETTKNLMKQRVRWAFGTMQCLAKHKDILFSQDKRTLGWFAMPGIWFFQVFLSALTPALDIYFAWSLATGSLTFALAFYFWAFMFMDIAITATGIWLEKAGDRNFRQLLLVIPMRFYYRTILSVAIWKALLNVIKGVWASWGKLDRTGAATASSSVIS